MKKLTALFVCIMMLAALAVSTSAAGEILWHEDFSDKFTNPQNWILDGNEFFCDDSTDASNPCIVAYDSGVVCQMQYSSEVTGNPRSYASCTMVSRVQVRDFDADGDHKVGFWWRDDFYEDAEELGMELGEIYNLLLNADTMTLELWVEGQETAIATAPVSGIEVGGDWFTMGWRIVPGNISCYVNDQKLIDYASAEVAAAQKSPILLLNNNCYVAFDDVVVATADYNLFNEASVAPTPGTTDNGGDVTTTANNNQDGDATQPVPTSRVENVEVTDEKGNAVTDEAGNKVTEQVVITDPPANTNPNAGVGGVGTTPHTGDATWIVVAVMVVTIGCAIVVKKVSVK